MRENPPGSAEENYEAPEARELTEHGTIIQCA
jgi:hypothetical protein